MLKPITDSAKMKLTSRHRRFWIFLTKLCPLIYWRSISSSDTCRFELPTTTCRQMCAVLTAGVLCLIIQKRMGVNEAYYQHGFSSLTGFGGGDGGAPRAGAKAAGAGAAGAAEEKPKEKEAFDLKLTEVPAAAKIKIIKEVRAITGLGLKEVSSSRLVPSNRLSLKCVPLLANQAKELVEKAPVVVKEGLKKEEAEKLKATIVEAGGKVELL
jgi:ribosomal protein L7/L12